jgi:type II secretory pathway component GspD/PulD (secretin)
LGALFTHNIKQKRKSNLIIEIKPKIIRKSAELQFINEPPK